MTEEIKRIIEDMDLVANYNKVPIYYTQKQIKTLLDYITNLQQLYENALKVNQNSHKYITELEMNNAILKEELKNRPIIDFTFDVYKELEDYKSRCEKAIEYIEKNYPTSTINYQDDKYKLINILNGSDDK